MKRFGTIAAVAAGAVAMGCTTMTPEQQGKLSGAAIGWTGAAVGAVTGGIIGNIRGSKPQ